MTTTVNLQDVLEAKEERYKNQLFFINKFKRPLISFTLNIPGNIKRDSKFIKVHKEGIKTLKLEFKEKIFYEKIFDLKTGPEAYFVIDCLKPQEIKEITVKIEEKHFLGRLFDMDVIGTDGFPLSRESLGFSPRKCIVCGGDVQVCMRERRHYYEEIIDIIMKIIDLYF